MIDHVHTISIVIPAYNAGTSLHFALDSVLHQSYPNWNAIIIDDGSEDDTCEIARDYVNADHRFKLLAQTNTGVSGARNLGLAHVNGDWITFLDADDALGETYLENLMRLAAKNEDTDIVIGGASEVGRQTRLLKNRGELQLRDEKKKDLLFSLVDSELHGDSGYCLAILGCIWAKLYRKDILNGIQFDTRISMREDAAFNLEAFSRARSIALSTHCDYIYRQSNSTTSRSFHPCYDNEAEALLSRFKAIATQEKFPDLVLHLGSLHLYMTWLKLFALHPQNSFSRTEEDELIRQSFFDEKWKNAFEAAPPGELKLPYRLLKHFYTNQNILGVRALKSLNDVRKVALCTP